MKNWIVAIASLLAFSAWAGSERAEQAWEMVNQGAVLIDVRTVEEFDTGHLNTAKNIPVQVLAQSDLSFLTKDQEIVVYCRSGNRSGKAEIILEQMGYTNVHNGGGYVEMMDAKSK